MTSDLWRTTGRLYSGSFQVGWEIWLDGTEITQFTYFQQMGGIECKTVYAELTYGTGSSPRYCRK